MFKVTDLSGLLLASSICTWPGVDIFSWPELELLCHSLFWPAGGRWEVVAEEGLGVQLPAEGLVEEEAGVEIGGQLEAGWAGVVWECQV